MPAVSRSAYCSSLMTLDHSRGRRARPAHAHAPLVELIAAAVQHVAVEAHQEPHLVGRARPVLGREGVDRQVLHARLDGAGDDVEQGGLARLVSLDAGEAAPVRPPPVAVHDDRDVLRHASPSGTPAGRGPSSPRRDTRRHPGACRASASSIASGVRRRRRARASGCRARGATARTRRRARMPRAHDAGGCGIHVRPVPRHERLQEARGRRVDAGRRRSARSRGTPCRRAGRRTRRAGPARRSGRTRSSPGAQPESAIARSR